MKLTLEIPDNKAEFMLELLGNLPFVNVKQEQRAKRAGLKEARSVHDFLREIEIEDGI